MRRIYRLALVLLAACSNRIDATQPAPNESDLPPEPFRLQHYDPRTLPAVRDHDVIITQGRALAQHPALSTGSHILVLDLYDPVVLENMETYYAESEKVPAGVLRWKLDAMLAQLRIGDFFLCASEGQWEQITEPLLAFCRQPRRAADQLQGDPPHGFMASSQSRSPGLPASYLMARAFETLRRRGLRAPAFEVRNYVHWWFGR